MADTKGSTDIKVRIAIREEGDFINAYLAQPGTLKNAVLFASMRRTVAYIDRDVFEKWKRLLTEMLNATMRDTFGVEADGFIEQSPPSGERSGSA